MMQYNHEDALWKYARNNKKNTNSKTKRIIKTNADKKEQNYTETSWGSHVLKNMSQSNKIHHSLLSATILAKALSTLLLK